MTHIIHLHTFNELATLERLLRVTRHRGFQVNSMNVTTSQNQQELEITLSVDSQRPVQLLFNQLGKIHNVHSVQVFEQHPTLIPIKGHQSNMR